MSVTEPIDVKIKKLYEDAHAPEFQSAGAAGGDLYAYIPSGTVAIAPHSTAKISAGFAMALPEGYVGLIFARSGLATKQGLRPANAVGVIDSDYRGEVIISLHNDSDETRSVTHSDRIAQLVVLKAPKVSMSIVGDLDRTERGAGGFGSTGI